MSADAVKTTLAMRETFAALDSNYVRDQDDAKSYADDDDDEQRYIRNGLKAARYPDVNAFRAHIAEFGLSATLLAAKTSPNLFGVTHAKVADKFRISKTILPLKDDVAETLHVLTSAMDKLTDGSGRAIGS